MFYCVQGEDNLDHPNAFFVPKPEGGAPISFEAFLQHFPFNADAFHFRFQVCNRSILQCGGESEVESALFYTVLLFPYETTSSYCPRLSALAVNSMVILSGDAS